MGNLLRGETGVGQDGLGMLSRLLWCRTLQDRVRLAEGGHGSDRLQGPELWVLVAIEIAVLQRLGVLRQHSIVLDQGAGDIRLHQTLEPVGSGLGGSALPEPVHELWHMASPHLRRREARVVDEFSQRKGTQDIHPLRANEASPQQAAGYQEENLLMMRNHGFS